MIDYLIFSLCGIIFGTLTGLIPGLHVNNITPFLVGMVSGTALDTYQAISLIVAMMMTHTFLDFIPSTFLGVPSEETALSVLPAHKFVLEGQGFEVIKLTALGSLGSLLTSAVMAVGLIPLIGEVYELINPYMHILLIFIVLVMFMLENSWRKRVISVGIFLLSGLLGVIILNSNLVAGDGALMPILGGLFGMSVLVVSINDDNELPEQEVRKDGIEVQKNIRSIFSGATAGVMTGVIPGVGPAQGTVLSQALTKSDETKDFLVGVSGVNTAKALLSFVALYAIGRPRSGAAVAVDNLIENICLNDLVFLIGIALLVGGIAALLHLKLGEIAAKNIEKLPYKLMCLLVISSIIIFSIYYAGFWGIPILLTSTAIGLLPASFNVKRTHCMGVLILPVILFFSGIEGQIIQFLGI